MDAPSARKPNRFQRWARALTWILLSGVAFWTYRSASNVSTPRRLPYSELVTEVKAGHVKAAEIEEDEITATLAAHDGKPEERVTAARMPNVDEAPLVAVMEEHGVAFSGVAEKKHPIVTALLTFVLPMAILLGLPWLMSGGLTRRGRPMSFARSQAKLYDRSAENRVTFADVAGVDEAKGELAEVVRFLKEPARYRVLGARIPKGVLLVGAPGTGKTLLARAVAGESGVPFFSLSGSEFVEMFVGVGASRVRDLFLQAKERGPCIIFIDELDAIGKARAGNTGFAVNEEREQTLNQLLVEMDGFDSGEGLVIMAATNRPEVLDPALLRAGRFDRQVVVERPDLRGREAILKVHGRKVKLGVDVDMRVIAQRTPGMVGADLANVVNEAALASVRRGAEHVDAADFDEAIDRIQLGLKKEGRVMKEDEKRRVAFHEAGHALVAMSVEHADPVHRVTIIARSVGALGATLQLPTQERYLMTRAELQDTLAVLLGGRSAEEVACGDVSTGAENDLQRATEIARQMVCRFGMSEKLGVATYERTTSPFLQMPDGFGSSSHLSEETSRAVDEEVRALLETAHARARKLVEERGPVLHELATRLLAAETLDRAEIEAIVGTKRSESGTNRTAPRAPAASEA